MHLRRRSGSLVAERRRSRGLTLRALAAEAHVGRWTLAALEAGKLAELGYGKVARICEAVDFVLRGDLDTWRGLVHVFSILLSGAVKRRRIAAAHA